MAPGTVKDIERAIETLSTREIAELYAWLDVHYPHPIDTRLSSDLSAGRLDAAIDRALEDEKNGSIRPL
ncbi:MAG: hypothetical protein ACHP8A_13050 [Terriglobales bacterium]|jgi:hypothetical protein